MSTVLYADGWAAVQALIDQQLRRAALAAALTLQAKLSREGSGQHWPTLPSRSSAPNEYPAYQFGPLARSIGVTRQERGLYGVGSIAGPPEAYYLEFKPGRRPWASKALRDNEIRAAMLRVLLAGAS